MRALASLVILCLAAGPAVAGPDVGVVVVGEPTMQPQLAAQLENWLRQQGHTVTPAPLPPEAINTLIDCFVIEDEGCARTVVEKRAKTKAVVFARIDIKPGDTTQNRTVTLTGYWFEKGHDAIAERRFCERCNEVTLRSTADELMAALTAAQAKDAGKLKVSSSPAGARVLVDGTPIGVTPLEYDLKTGPHKVTVARSGHRDATRDVTINRGETAEVDVLLTSQISSSFFPTLLLGTGGVLLATGLVLLVIDEDVPARDAVPQKEFYQNTGPLGFGLAVSGVVVGGIGGYLLFRSKRSSTPVASLTSDSAYVGWAGRF